MAEELQIILTAIDRMSGEINSAVRSLKGIELQVQKTQSVTDGMKGAFLGAAKSLVGLAAGYVSLRSGIAFLKDSVAASLESEKAATNLKATVEALGISYNEQKDTINASIQAASQYAVVQDEEVSAVL